MPPKNQKPDGASKMAVKNLDEKETAFEPTPYETTDVCTSITLLSSPEIPIVIRALWTLSKYSDTKEANVEFLYKNGIVTVLLHLINYSDLTILRFTLKLLGQVVSTVPAAAQALSLEEHNAETKQINYIFMTVEDTIVKEFTALILSRIVKGGVMASCLFRTGVIAPIFIILKTTQDPDVQLNTLTYFSNLLEAREAAYVLPLTAEFSPRTLLCYLKSKVSEIREAALIIIEKLTAAKASPMQALLQNEHVIEVLLKIILNKEYKQLHKKAFSIIHTCMECPETACYFVKSLEFIQFCQWAKTCPKKYILPSAVILTALAKLVELRQILFDFSVEDTILSFFRIDSELVFYKTCEAVSHMSSHRYCCEKMITPVVIQCLLDMLTRSNIPIIPYHEIALKTIHDLMKKDARALKLIVAAGGITSLTECWLRKKDEYTDEGVSVLMEMLYMFSADENFQLKMMNSMMYEMLLNTLDDASDFSGQALLVLNQYVGNSECRQYFIEFGGPDIVLKKIKSTPNEKMFKNILVFLQRMFIYKRVGMVFLWAGCLQVLKSICEKVKASIPLIDQLITMMYDLYIPIKFHDLGRLEITDHFNSRFHLVIGPCDQKEFPFLEILVKQQACPLNTVYVVDFTANPAELTQKPIKLPPELFSSTSLAPSASTLPKVVKSTQFHKRASILKNTSNSRIPKVSIQIRKSFSVPFSSEANDDTESVANYLTCQIPAPINYGYISADPYLPKYVEKLKVLMYNNKKYIMCFQHQVKLIASFVNDVLSGPEGIDASARSHFLEIHKAMLKEKLGVNIIPIGFLRCGHYCEKALLFKALSEKLGVPTTLVRGKIEGQNNLLFWNEVPIINDEPYANIDDEQKTYMAYAVVDLVDKIGELMLVGSVEANKYCGLITDNVPETVKPIKVESKLVVDNFHC